MSKVVIELNDSGIIVASEDGLILESPGYAILKEDEIQVGAEAFEQSRLHPRQSHNQFWNRLSLDSLPHPTAKYRHQADLAHAHLLSIGNSIEDVKEVIFAVPPNYAKEQLSMLLGVAQESPLQIVGLVDCGVAAASQLPLEPAVIFVDMQLHQTVLSLMQVGKKIKRTRVEVLPDAGMVTLYDRWVKLIADQFIEQCRFDPLHNAITEQALYRHLPDWVKALKSNEEVTLEIESSGSRFQARLLQSSFVEKTSPVYKQISDAITSLLPAEAPQVLLTDRIAGLPGIEQRLPLHHALEPTAVTRGCHANLDSIVCKPESLQFITALPASNQNNNANTTKADIEHVQPSHLLLNHIAYGLDRAWFGGVAAEAGQLMINDDLHSLDQLLFSVSEQGILKAINGAKVFLNDQVLGETAELSCGDQITVSGSKGAVRLIREA